MMRACQKESPFKPSVPNVKFSITLVHKATKIHAITIAKTIVINVISDSASSSLRVSTGGAKLKKDSLTDIF